MVGMLSDIGNVRKINQDYIGKYEDDYKKLYVVADGMGGHNAGEIASKIAVEKLIKYIKKDNEEETPSKLLVNAIKYANEEVFHLASKNKNYVGMGTTITACLIVNHEMIVGNVGDSRCYITNSKGMFKVTKDHSLVQQLVDTGAISKEEALYNPNRNVITRAIGTRFSVKVDVFSVKLDNVEKVLLCTDGLTKEIDDDELFDILKSNNDNQVICHNLIDKCKLKGANDNISVIVFEGECK